MPFVPGSKSSDLGAIIFHNDLEYRISVMANRGSGLESTRALSRWGLEVEPKFSC
jgi:hypothetical protein